MVAVKTGPDIESEKEERQAFLPYQRRWILDESQMRLAEKSVRVGWTYCDAFKNVRKRLRHKKRDYLFQTKDEATAVEYVAQCYEFAEIYNQTKTIVAHGVETWKVERFDLEGKATGFTDEVKVGVIKFDNGSRILAFSRNPNALRAFGGDVGWDEAAFHPAAEALWASASGRITWGYDIGVWSSHNGDNTLFLQFVKEAKAGLGGWSFHRVDIYEAIKQGLVEKINQARGTQTTREEFLEGCKRRARLPEIFAQEYECNPRGGMDNIVPWTVIEACTMDLTIDRQHLDHHNVVELFGEFRPEHKEARDKKIHAWLMQSFGSVLAARERHRLGFDVAASGQGDLAAIYIDSDTQDQSWNRALLTMRTEDWDFMETANRWFMDKLTDVKGCGDETGLGRQICWNLSKKYPGRFEGVNFSSEKGDMGVTLMGALSAIAKRFPKQHPDIAADYYAIRKSIAGSKVTFHEGTNAFNPHSHCDIAYAGMLAERARKIKGAAVTLTLC